MKLSRQSFLLSSAVAVIGRSKRQIPLILVGGILQRETVAEFITRGAYDCIEMGRIGHWGTVREQQARIPWCKTQERARRFNNIEFWNNRQDSASEKKEHSGTILCTPRVPQSGVFAVFLPFAVS